MSDQVQESVATTSGDAGKKPRKQRSDKGQPRGPRKPKVATTGV